MSQVQTRIFRLYFAIVALLTFFAVVGGTESLVNIGLKTFIITSADAPTNTTDCDAKVFTATKTKTVDDLKTDCVNANTTALRKYHQEKANDLNDDIALLLVMTPLFALHFTVLYREWKKSEKTA